MTTPEVARTLAPVLNLIGIGFLIAAQVDAARHRDRRERASCERPQPPQNTRRGKVLLRLAGTFIGLGVLLIVVGIVAD